MPFPSSKMGAFRKKTHQGAVAAGFEGDTYVCRTREGRISYQIALLVLFFSPELAAYSRIRTGLTKRDIDSTLSA